VKVALYARYSSDNQREASIADQFRICRTYAEKQGWHIVDEYSDQAISGASLLRPGIQALITDALRSRFDIVLAEAMDRLSRDQEDIAGLFKRFAFSNVKMVTLSEGDVTHLHVGLKGTMNALFLKDLADKVRRGLRGRVEDGKSGGGNSYGYDVVKSLDAKGEPIRGDRTINQAEAEAVRRIFREYVAGASPKQIATVLNREAVRGPAGREWGFTTIYGSPKRGNGILNNEMYIGLIVWNRQRFIKDPDTGKRVSRLNPRADWVVQEVPELRIVEQDLWDAVKARQRLVKQNAETSEENAIWERRRARYLLSGLTRCGVCGGGVSMISASHVGCSTARNKGTCSNRMAIKRIELEERVLGALKSKLMDPALFREFCNEFTREMNRLRINGRASLEAARSEIERIDRELDTLLNLILKGGAAEKINAKMVQLEARKRALERALAEAQEPPPLLHPEMATFYREQVTALHLALGAGDDQDRAEAAERLRSLLSKIVLTPEDGKLAIDVHGDLAGILAIARAKGPSVAADGVVSQAKPVAGTRSRQLKHQGRPGGAADVADIAQQVKLVAGARNHRQFPICVAV
jgi:DNA invertase Pin-like site-specific DNA recombinase